MPGPSQGTHRGSVGLGRRFKPRERALEQQLVARRVSGAKVEEAADAGLEKLPRALVVVLFVHLVGELSGRLAEHGIVNGVLRVEVGVHGGRRDPGAAGQVSQRQTGQALLAHQCPSGNEDRIACRLSARFAPVRPCSWLYHRSLLLHSVKALSSALACWGELGPFCIEDKVGLEGRRAGGTGRQNARSISHIY